MQCESYTKYII